MDGTTATKIAVVTGAARGFGKAFSEALAARGVTVLMADIDLAAAEAGARRICAAGGNAAAVECDVSDEASVSAVMRLVANDYGGLDILINNAGLHSEEYNVPMSKAGVEKLRRLFDVNQMGTIICTLAAIPLMEGRQGAAIVNIASAAAYLCSSAYGVSKLAVRGLTMAFARELGPNGIRVNAIAPGLIMTETIRTELNPATIAYVKSQQALDFEGEESDIVAAMLYLTSSSARFITGETLKIGGGFTMAIG